jgi:hypothetical protein
LPMEQSSAASQPGSERIEAVRNRPAALLIAPSLCALALAAAGCGGGGGTKYSGADTDVWAATVCGALGDWARGLQADSRALSSELRSAKSIDSVKARFVMFLTRAGTNADAMIEKVHGVGPPAAEDGRAIQAQLEKGLNKARNSLTRAEQRAKALPTSDARSFMSGVTVLEQDVQRELRATGKTFEELDRYNNEDLNSATSREPACTRLSASASASA